ncbi:FIG007317: Chromosome segregation protein SMC-like, partial [hydrothermal vent metagenome]
KVDAIERMNTLRVNFNNLDKAHQAIVKAKHQLEHLNPLVKGLDQFEKIVEGIERLDDVRAKVPAYFADCKLSLVRKARQEGLLQLDKIHNQLRNLRQELEGLRKEEIKIMTAIDQDSHGQRMKELQEQIDQLSIEAARKQKQAERYSVLAEKLALKTEPSEKQFYATREKVSHLNQQAVTRQEELIQQRDDLKIKLNESGARIVQLEEELQSLLERKTQIPLKNLQLRDRLSKNLNIDQGSLPFVGELLKVKDTEKDWEGAIERVLHNFGLRILVPQEYYKRVNHYVNKTDLKGRIVYHKVEETIFPAIRSEGEGLLYQKIEIMPMSSFYDWIKHTLQTRFDYVCCMKIEQFSKEVKAITQEGLIKREGALHEKDDRRSLHNRSAYILGWDNKEKISALREQLLNYTKERDMLIRRVKAIETKQADVQMESEALRDLFVFEDYQEINVKKPQVEMAALKKNMMDLEKGSSVLKQLKKDLEAVKVSLKEKDEECRQKEKQETNLERDAEEFNRVEQECEGILEDVVIEELKHIEEDMVVFLKETVLTIRNCDKVQQRVATSLFDQDKQKNQQRERLEKRVVIQMEKYKSAFPEEGLEVDSSIESASDFRRMQTTIMKDDLPRYEKRFKELLDQKVIMDVSSFYNFLTKHVSIIKEKIQSLNHSLKSIDYSPATYIELNTESNRDVQIKEFQLMLKECFEDVGITDRKKINEDSFFKIKKIIEKFDTEEYWTRKVVDVRNWLNFSASERYREDHSEKNYYSDSSGKSGGQKAKLAYTILASAIAYQYGINQTTDMFATSADMSFRFVVIDEAFSKSDDANAQYAMELFQKLNLQLLVVTPLDKANVVEPYISACHYVANTEKENDSKVYNLTIEEYHQKKKLLG